MNGWPSGNEQPVVGVIGLGSVGSQVGLRLCRAGFRIVAFDARAEAVEPLVQAGATAAESVPGTAASCDVLITALPGPAQVDAVMAGSSGAFQALREGSVWVDVSWCTPAASLALAREGARRGVAVVDAPVAGLGRDAGHGPVRAFAGGTVPDVERVRPVLEAVADAGEFQQVGARGAGYAVRLCLDLCRSIHEQAGAEVLMLGQAAGVNADILRGVLATADDRAHAGLPETRDAALRDEAARHLALAVDLGRELGVPLELAALVEQLRRRGGSVVGDTGGGGGTRGTGNA